MSIATIRPRRFTTGRRTPVRHKDQSIKRFLPSHISARMSEQGRKLYGIIRNRLDALGRSVCVYRDDTLASLSGLSEAHLMDAQTELSVLQVLSIKTQKPNIPRAVLYREYVLPYHA